MESERSSLLGNITASLSLAQLVLHDIRFSSLKDRYRPGCHLLQRLRGLLRNWSRLYAVYISY